MSMKYFEDNKSDRLDLDKIPEEIVAVPTKWEMQPDSKKRNCLYVDFMTVSDVSNKVMTFTQKYSPYHFEELRDAFKGLKIDGFVEATDKKLKLRMKKKHFTMGFARFIPVEIIK